MSFGTKKITVSSNIIGCLNNVNFDQISPPCFTNSVAAHKKFYAHMDSRLNREKKKFAKECPKGRCDKHQSTQHCYSSSMVEKIRNDFFILL